VLALVQRLVLGSVKKDKAQEEERRDSGADPEGMLRSDIRKKLGNTLRGWNPMKTLNSYWKAFDKFIIGRVPLRVLHSRSKELVTAISGWKSIKALGSHWDRLRQTVCWSKPLEKLHLCRKAVGISTMALPAGGERLVKKGAFVLACIVFAAGIVFWTRRNILNFEEETVTKVNQYMVGVASEKAQCIEQFVQEIQDYVALLARKPFSGEFNIRQPLPYNDYVAGEALLEHVGDRVDSIYRIDKKGMVLHRVPYKKGAIGQDVSNMPGIQFVLENHESYVSEVFALYPGVSRFSVCHPVFHDDNFMGAICIMIFLDTLNKSACRIQVGSAGSIWVIDQKGLILSHSNPEFIGRSILEAGQDTSSDVDWSEFEDIVRRMMNGEEGHGVYRSAARAEARTGVVKKAVTFLPINLGDQMWSIAITMDYEEIADPIRRNTRSNFLVATLMMAIFGAIGAIYYRNQKRKAELEAIARSAEELRITNENLKFEIQQRIQAEEAREQSESDYRLLAENVLDIIWIADLNYRFTYISPSVTQVLGFNPEEAIGQTINTILPPASIDAARKALAKELANGGEQRIDKSRACMLEMALHRRDGSTVWTETKISLLYDSKDRLAGLLGVTRDITEKMQLQHQFFQAQKMESIGTLAGGIAHDFNNLLGGILGYASLMKAKLSKNHQAFSYADTIEKSANRAAELTAQLLAFARGGKYEPKVVNFNSIVDETLEIIGRTFNKSIEIRVFLGESIPTVEADAGQIQQVLMNLCVNARDAMTDGGNLTIETYEETLTAEQAESHAEAQPGSYIVLSVADSGVGMDRETMKRIFEPFYTTKEKGKGTGLGLSMVYGVVKNHGGHVHVSSEPGKGSKFKVYLPASGKSETRDTNYRQMTRGGNELILVVDDEEVVRALAKDALESYGYRVLLAKDGEEAIDIYREKDGGLGLVIIDMVMPKLGGRETFLKLRELNPNVKAILATGYSLSGEANEILRSGVMGFIQKPFQLDELLAKVRTVLDMRPNT
jgi:PAS domain S-box-containing protein